MATFINAFMVQKFNWFVLFLFIFVIVYAILEKSNWFKNKNLDSIIALAVAFLSLMNPNVVSLIEHLIPWFFIILLVSLFILVAMMNLGVEEKNITKAMSTWGPFHITLIGFIGLVILLVIAQVYGSQFMTIASGKATNQSSISHTIQVMVQPQVLALIFVFIVAGLAVLFLTNDAAPPPTR